jgi:CheY-like chemotaxis protein
LKAYPQGDKVYFEIEDNGCGIPKEHQDSIYTPSFTLKGGHDKTGSYKSEIQGTGYGMSNVKKYIVEKHKGDISLESEVGKGTRITVALRIIKNQLSSAEKKEVVKSQIYDKRRILLVEDESAIADVQYQILTKEPFGHIVSMAVNGQAAIDGFDRNKFDAVSLDYMLPGNINGLDVYNHIRKCDKDIPVMFISGNIEFLESIQKLREKDPNIEHLSKPVDNLDYVNKINELIGKSIKVKGQFERRKNKRFIPCNTTAGVIKSDSSKKYQIIDISMGGLAYRYTERGDRSIRLNESDELTINLAEVGFYLDNMPCKTISDVTLAEDSPSGYVLMKRCSIQFDELTPNQTNQLDYFIENHTIAA